VVTSSRRQRVRLTKPADLTAFGFRPAMSHGLGVHCREPSMTVT
jgi:hypothetical protein